MHAAINQEKDDDFTTLKTNGSSFPDKIAGRLESFSDHRIKERINYG